MVEIVRGAIDSNPVCKRKLEKYFSTTKDYTGVLYFGYPIIKEKTSLDALLITQEYGIIIFDLFEGQASSYDSRMAIRDEIYNIVDSTLKTHPNLMSRREGLYSLNILTYAPSLKEIISNIHIPDCDEVIVDLDEIPSKLQKWGNPEKYDILLSAIQVATKIKTQTKRTIKNSSSKGAIIQKVENSISTLDIEQNKAIIETTNGIQRIRGLAGSGKSIVLALKAAYLYSLYPEYKIVITFNTRALKQLFKNYISRFVWEYTHQDYDENRLLILNSWGSPTEPGLYSDICSKCGIEYINYAEAKQIGFFSARTPVQAVYDKAATDIITKEKILYDVILVDEAQDLPESFFKLCQSVLDPKNGKLVIAYDELQNLTGFSTTSLENFFKGKDFSNDDDKPKKDIILPVCYRTSKEILVTAHALGFGIYNSHLIQLFNNPQLWHDVGYKVTSGELEYNHKVALERSRESSPAIFPEAKDTDILCKSFNTVEEEAEWVASSIYENLSIDELTYKDILVIAFGKNLIDRYAGLLREKLIDKNINSHIAGVTTEADTFYVDKSITISSIFRAKGNEASIVYIIGIQNLTDKSSYYQEMKNRNFLFTSITRSKLWVRLSGVGDISNFKNEIQQVKDNHYSLKFVYPAEEEFKKMYRVYSESQKAEKEISGKIEQIRKKLGDKIYDELLKQYKSPEAVISRIESLYKI